MNKLSLQEQCQLGQICNRKDCAKKHYRCFAGLCINGRLSDPKNGICKDNECKLLHLSQQQYKTELNISPINGIYRFNICQNQSCKQQNICPFLHPKWALKYCIQFVMDICIDETHSNHTEWNDIREEVNKENQNKLKEFKCNPENNLESEQKFFDDNKVCMQFLKGMCEKKNGFCVQKHIFWEDLSKIKFLQMQTLRSCIIENNAKNYSSLDKHISQSLLIDDKQLEKLQNAIKNQNIVDVIFIMDFTGSMKLWMETCKSSIKGIIETFQRNIKQCTLRIGMVGYRDVNDKQKLAIHELTSEANLLTSFLSRQVAQGGGDAAEDVCSGIEKAMTLNISKHPESILITILFADAPCHGKQYHDGVSDHLANKVTPNTLENLMQRYYRMKNNNFFTCVNITKHTVKMYDIMKNNFQGLFISKPSSHEDFENLVQFTLKDSIRVSQSYLKKQYKAEFQKPKLIEYFCETDEDKNQFWQRFDTILPHRTGETIIEIYEKQLSDNESQSGINSKVFLFYDAQINQSIVIKISKKAIELYEKNQLSTDLINQYEEQAKARYYTQAKAQQLSQIFRQRTLNIKGAPPIFFPLPVLYTLKKQTFFGLSKLYGEVYINIPEVAWEKYSNNGIYINSDYYYFSAFSHFVFEETQRWFTFTDIQGKRNLLSDPAIQTVENYKSIDAVNFDPQNLKGTGIGKFLLQHQECSQICKELGLKKYSNIETENQKKWQSAREDGLIDIFCENCDTQSTVTFEEFKKKKYQQCQECIDRYPDMQDNFCQCCRSIFQITLNLGLKNLTNVNKCLECKQKCLDKSKQCYYCKMDCPYKVQKVSTNGIEMLICKKGKSYLDSLKCQLCSKTYDYTFRLNENEYEKGKYNCQKCRQ